MLQLDASALAACLDREALIDALDAAFRGSAVVPPRQQYAINSRPAHAAARSWSCRRGEPAHRSASSW